MRTINFKRSTVEELRNLATEGKSFTIEGEKLKALIRLVQAKGYTITDGGMFKGHKCILIYEREHYKEYFGIIHRPSVPGQTFPCAVTSFLLSTPSNKHG
jgi:hypothetical protein